MNIAMTILAAAVAATALSASAQAQGAEFRLPDQCVAASGADGMDHAAMGHGDAAAMDMTGMDGADLDAMPEHVRENMRKMMVTLPAMNEGMMNEDADVAFACAMIAHHQGAIDMAQVLLAHGEDPQMRSLAETIIAAQVGEIEQMTTWLAENAD